MNKIENVNITRQNEKYVMDLGKNHNVCKVRIELSNTTTDFVTVEYAQNNVTSSLVFWGRKEATSDFMEFEVDTPISVSHIYISYPYSCSIKNIDIYESKNINFNDCYPKCFDIDLKKNYYLDSIAVFTPEDGYSQYTVYTSMDDRDYTELAKKISKEKCNPKIGEVYSADGREARFIRVYIEYNSTSVLAVLNDVKITGTPSGTKTQNRPEICIDTFDKSKYNVAITNQDTYDEIYGIIQRRIGKKYKSWFTFELTENPQNGHTYDYFEITTSDRKIHIKGNNGVSLASGLNHYLKYFCHVNISQVGDQVKMPNEIIYPDKAVFKETKAGIRYSYNYCTMSYTMAFWGRNEWRNELDWLALNGVNVVLDITAQEEVWRRFLKELGYDHRSIKAFITGPAYYAWAYMANVYGFGGPVHDSWFKDRTELARENHLVMRKLGMQPVLQGYSGMVPVDIKKYDEDVEIIPQGTWCSFERPSMLKTTSPMFKKYADKFYKAQREVYGDISCYYATDPFHEGGDSAGISERAIAKEVLSAMLKENPDSIWIIQSWQGNPRSELLAGLDEVAGGKEHALILDLYAEVEPHYNNGAKDNPSHGYTKEFDNTPWLFCMLNNFGGRSGMYGHLDTLSKSVPAVLNECHKIAGIGITPEASHNNPVLYDFLFESVWQDNCDDALNEINLDTWLAEYVTRRYGAKSDAATAAWDILKDTVYSEKSWSEKSGQGSPECVVNARPALEINSASTWGYSTIGYDKQKLKDAAKLLLKDYDILKESDGYIYDIVTVIQQVLSNEAQDCHRSMVKAYIAKNAAEFEQNAEQFMCIIDKMDKVTGSNKHYMLGSWIEQAKTLAENTDDFTKRIYEINAKALVTTWGAYKQSEGGLHDYSNRQWSGLFGDFYKPRWERWISAKINELNGRAYKEDCNLFEWEREWVRKNTVYPTKPVVKALKDSLNII